MLWAKYLPPNWGAYTEPVRRRKDFLLQFQVAKRPAILIPLCRQAVQVLGGGELYGLQTGLGGTSAEACLKTVKLASTKYLDSLPTQGNEYGRAFRDLELEEKILAAAHRFGIGAQFGGKYFAHDVRIIRLPRMRILRWGWGYPAPPTEISRQKSTGMASGLKRWNRTRGGYPRSLSEKARARRTG